MWLMWNEQQALIDIDLVRLRRPIPMVSEGLKIMTSPMWQLESPLNRLFLLNRFDVSHKIQRFVIPQRGALSLFV